MNTFPKYVLYCIMVEFRKDFFRIWLIVSDESALTSLVLIEFDLVALHSEVTKHCWFTCLLIQIVKPVRACVGVSQCVHACLCLIFYVHVCARTLSFHCSHIPYSLNVLSLMSTGRSKLDVSVPNTRQECKSYQR